MIIRIVGTGPDAETLLSRVQTSLDELGLLSVTTVEIYDTPQYREELKVQEPLALCIEEPAIGFRDMIFEGIIPESHELNSLFISLFGSGEEKKGCGTCSTGGCETCAC